ncbi:hypothetical protein Tco_1243124 [Tanacetum coccineum]
MTTPVIDLMTMQSDSPLPTSTTTTSIITTTTSLPPPPQPQQSTADPILVSRIGELEQHMADLIQNNLALEERDLPTVDMKEILQQRMFEDNSYKAHEEEARKKKRKKHAAPRTPSGSLPSLPPPPPPPKGASGALSISATRHQGSKLVQAAASTHQSMAWTTSDTRFESTGFTKAQESSPTDSLMQDDSIPDEQVHLSDDEDSENDHLPKADSRQDWWKPLPEEERPATPEPAWTIPSSNVSDIEKNWASALVSTYETPAQNSLLAKTEDMETFMKWYCRQVNKTKLTQVDFKGQAYEVVKLFYPDVIHLQFQMEECHKMLTAQVDWTNLEGDHVRIDVNRPLPLGGPPSHRVEDLQLDIERYQTQLNLTTLGWDATCYKFKHDYTIIESPRAVVFPVDNNDRKIMRFNEIYKFSDGTLTRILEALDYRVKEFKVKRLNPSMNTRFWTEKDVTRSKEFIAAIERKLKTRRIYWNLECFVGGRVRYIDYILLQRTE